MEPPVNEEYEEPGWKGDEELPPPKLKPLPNGLRYEFLDDSNKDPIINSTDLPEKRKNQIDGGIEKAPQGIWVFPSRS
jgi:hypothetical protein